MGRSSFRKLNDMRWQPTIYPTRKWYGIRMFPCVIKFLLEKLSSQSPIQGMQTVMACHLLLLLSVVSVVLRNYHGSLNNHIYFFFRSASGNTNFDGFVFQAWKLLRDTTKSSLASSGEWCLTQLFLSPSLVILIDNISEAARIFCATIMSLAFMFRGPSTVLKMQRPINLESDVQVFLSSLLNDGLISWFRSLSPLTDNTFCYPALGGLMVILI